MTRQVNTPAHRAIITRYYGATTYRPAKIIARCWPNITAQVSYNDGLEPDRNHYLAAEKIMDKMQWDAPLYGGSLGNATYCWVMLQL